VFESWPGRFDFRFSVDRQSMRLGLRDNASRWLRRDVRMARVQASWLQAMQANP
jgi:hypothetical protein